MPILIHIELFRSPVLFHGMAQGNCYAYQLGMLTWVSQNDTNWHWHYFMRQGEWLPPKFRYSLMPPEIQVTSLLPLCAFTCHVSCSCLSLGDSRVAMPFRQPIYVRGRQRRRQSSATWLCVFSSGKPRSSRTPHEVSDPTLQARLGIVDIIQSHRNSTNSDLGSKDRGRSECYFTIRIYHKRDLDQLSMVMHTFNHSI